MSCLLNLADSSSPSALISCIHRLFPGLELVDPPQHLPTVVLHTILGPVRPTGIRRDIEHPLVGLNPTSDRCIPFR